MSFRYRANVSEQYGKVSLNVALGTMLSVFRHRDLDDAGNLVNTFKISRRFQFSSNLKKRQWLVAKSGN